MTACIRYADPVKNDIIRYLSTEAFNASADAENLTYGNMPFGLRHNWNTASHRSFFRKREFGLLCVFLAVK